MTPQAARFGPAAVQTRPACSVTEGKRCTRRPDAPVHGPALQRTRRRGDRARAVGADAALARGDRPAARGRRARRPTRRCTTPGRRRRSASATTSCSSATARSRRPRRSSRATTCSTAPTSTRRSAGRGSCRSPSTGRSRCARSSRRRTSRRVTDVERAFREHHGSVLAVLIRHVGDFDLAEEALQDAFAAAAATWPRDGVPRQPGRLARDDRQAARDRPHPPRAGAARCGRRGWPSCRSARARTTRSATRERRSWTTACG